MATRVTITTGDCAAIVLSYPRQVDPVFGEELTEVAQIPPHFEQAFTLEAGFDLLVAEMPVETATPAGERAIPLTLPGEATSEAA